MENSIAFTTAFFISRISRINARFWYFGPNFFFFFFVYVSLLEFWCKKEKNLWEKKGKKNISFNNQKKILSIPISIVLKLDLARQVNPRSDWSCWPKSGWVCEKIGKVKNPTGPVDLTGWPDDLVKNPVVTC